MKYRRLSKEQLESLHEEFTKFLATQSIDKSEWEKYKHENDTMVKEQLDVFSDIVWEDVLTKTLFLEHFSSNVINLFKCEESKIQRIVIKTDSLEVDFTQKTGYQWLLKNTTSDTIEVFQGEKPYSNERNLEVFDLIEKGSVISKGDLFIHFNQIINT